MPIEVKQAKGPGWARTGDLKIIKPMPCNHGYLNNCWEEEKITKLKIIVFFQQEKTHSWS